MQLRAPLSGRPVFARGGSLIEVLVSIVIASIGLLALAGANAAAARYAKLSQFRATAALLANDVGERMRANKAGFTAGAYDYTDDFDAQATAASVPNPACNTALSACTAAEIAAVDLYQWRSTVRSMLPEGSVNLTYNAAQVAADVYVVWRDPEVQDADERPQVVNECPNTLSRGTDESIRCMFFRGNI